MNPLRLILRELAHRRIGAVLAVLAAMIPAAAVGISLVLLADYRVQSEAELAERRAEIAQRADELKDDVRKIMKKLGFNLRILPADIDLASVYSEGYAEATMPEDYADRLAEWTDESGAPVVTVNHLLPALRRKVRWPEAGDRTVIVVGIKGQVPLAHGDPKKPIEQPVAAGSAKIGSELAQVLDLAVDDSVTLLGRDYRIAEIHAARGNVDDISIWIPLADAQALFDLPGRVNEIWALGCNCSTDDLARLTAIRDEVQSILPDTRVIEDLPAAMTRALARTDAARKAAEAIEDEAAHRARLQDQRAVLAAWVVSAVALLAGAWVAVLTILNLRERRTELALWRAMGVGGARLLVMMTARAVLVGLLGAVLGLGVSVAVAFVITADAVAVLPDIIAVVMILVGVPVLTLVAAWFPTLNMLMTDPAMILREQ